MNAFTTAFTNESASAMLEAIQRTHLQFIANADTRDAFQKLLKSFLELSGSRFGLIAELAEGGKAMRTHAINDLEWEAQTRALYEGRLPKDAEARGLYVVFEAVMATRAAVTFNDPEGDERMLDRGIACTSQALMGLPLTFGDEMVGIAIAADRPGGYPEALCRQLESYCATCAHLIIAFRENIKRQRAEAALRESEARFRMLADAAPVLLWMSDAERKSFFFNEGWLQFRGRSIEEEAGEGWLEGVHPHDRHRCQTVHLAATEAHAPFSVEYRLLRHDGEYRWLLDRGVPRFDPNGNFAGYIGACSDVTEIKAIETALSDSRAQLAGVIDTAMDAIISIDERQEIRVFNAAAERMFGYRAEQVMGQPLEILLPERFRVVHRSHVEVFKTAGERSAAMGAARELRALHASGREFPIEASISRCRVAGKMLLTVIVRDVTKARELADLRAAQTAVEAEARARLAGVIDTAMDAIITVDEDQRIRVFNAAAERIFGYTAAEIAGEPLDRLLPERFRGVHRSHVEHFKGAGERSAAMGAARELRALRADGTEFPIEASISRCKVAGRLLLTVIVRDVSKLRELAAAREAQSTAEAANQAKTVFLSRISHELRTPLNAVLGFAQLLNMDETEQLSQRQREQVDHIIHAGEHLLGMITELLDLTRIEAGQMRIEHDPVSVCDAIRRSVNLVEPLASAHGIEVMCDLKDCDRVLAYADGMRLTQVLVNLLTNAIKYNQRGGHVCVRGLVGEPGRVGIEVSDDGFGMDDDQLTHLFEAFNRLGREHSRVDGAGIGLALAKQLLALMGGAIEVRSTPGRGSVFTVTLERADATT